MNTHIAEIEVINLHMDYPNRQGFRYSGGLVTGRVTSLLRVTTEDGTIGLGACYAYPDLVRIIIERHLGPHLLGKDALEIEVLWDMMYALTRWYGRKGVAISTLGGLDIAFWDLRGKALGKPVYELLGAERNRVPAYASGLFWQDDVSALEKEAARHMQKGFRRVKTRLGRSEAYDVAALEAIRRGLGNEGEIMADGSQRYTLKMAEKIGKLLTKDKVFWFEEPFPPEELDNYVALRPRLGVPIAAGENEFGAQGFQELFRAGAVGIAQPDACRTGGITASLRVARMAAEAGVKIAPHTWSDAVALTANAHVVAALPHGLTVEVDQTGNPFIEELLQEPLKIQDGLLQLSQAPGLGITLNSATVGRYAMPAGHWIPDGNYSDLIFGAEYLSTPPPYETGAGRA
jgi:D-galactarolactone cycloisomerase